jgi:hypothetical protein
MYRIKKKIYVCDMLNIFSDYREIKYIKKNINFHDIKHTNLREDTITFFNMFFTKYINRVNIGADNKFIFILKKINKYENILCEILRKYPDIDINFFIIQNKYNNILLDKNKDDFLCQYLLKYYNLQNTECHIITNDLYRDKKEYCNKYTELIVNILNYDKKSINSTISKIKINSNLNLDITYQTRSKSIPKYKLSEII